MGEVSDAFETGHDVVLIDLIMMVESLSCGHRTSKEKKNDLIKDTFL